MYNRFACLPEIVMPSPSPISQPETESIKVVQNAKPASPRTRRPNWERTIPPKLRISALDSQGTSLHLQVELENTANSDKRTVRTLLDSGATGMFIDRTFAERSNIPM